MNKFLEVSVDSLSSLAKNSILFLDDASAECLHWCNGLSKLLDAGALDIRDIKHTKECLESETKGVFVVTTPLYGQISKYIQRIVKSSDFNHCIVVSSLTQHVNDFISSGNNSFSGFSQKVKLWMQNEFATVDIYYIPLFNIMVTKELFITPAHNNLFPILPSDVARLQAFLHVRGDKRAFNNLGDVDFGFMPHNMQSQVKMLSSSLNSMFESMDIHEDCYAVGHFSRLVATELANMPDAKGRRKMASSRASIIFVDRTLDLVSPMSHASDNVLGTIYEVLPRLKNHNNDVAVDLQMLFADGNATPTTLFPGCLAHTGNQTVDDVLNTFIMKSKEECISYLCDKLKEFMQKEEMDFTNSESTLSLLKNRLDKFRNNIQLFKKYSGFLQCAIALFNVLSGDEKEHLDELLSAEKAIMIELGEDNSNPFSQILSILAKKDCQQFSVVDALMFCLFIYSAGNKVSNASPAQEEKLKEALIRILMDGNHKEDLLFIIGDLDASERQIRTRIADIFERLRGIGEARNELKQLQTLIYKDSFGLIKYKPILIQILEQIFDTAKLELIDVEFLSHGFRDFLKTGFGFFMNISKPRPDDHPLIMLFVLGGITWYEIRSIREALQKLKPKQKVIIGSTRLITPTDTLEQVLCSENLFVDVDT